MASAFDELRDTCENSIKKLSSVAPRISSATPDQSKQLNSEATRYQKDAETAIRRMETEARSSPPSSRRALQDTIAQVGRR